MARTVTARIEYNQALLEGRIATANFLEAQDPDLGRVRPPEDMICPYTLCVYNGGTQCYGEIEEAK